MAALDAALAEVHGIEAGRYGQGIARGGRTDGEIARLTLLEAGVSALRIDSLTGDVREACCRRYAELCPPDLSDTVIPGIPDALSWLAGVGGVRLALLTGNLEPVARLKLARAGIGRFFEGGLGAFGSDSEDRAALPAIARRRAGVRGVSVARDQTIVVGDTPRDIACARADGALSLAVATGRFGVDELTGADAVARDASELPEKLVALGVPGPVAG
jgi:phosphoglycolate phosphatase-like HAD superfamily hydrolase